MGAKYIYICRNPFDCCVSFFYHTKAMPEYEFQDGTFDEFFEMFIEGKVDFGDYFDHVLSWYEHRNDPNVLFLTYEDLKKDTATWVLKIADFLGEEYEATSQDVLETPMSGEFVRKGVVGDWRNHFSADQIKRLKERIELKTRGSDLMRLWKDTDIP
ncbi:hypothetical protein HPB47_015159 [Ixodes persulcatus]|uniref:Uncharacterized protein n=1 Tax=Ixodes persulcatus TaxID=34615 RepID=A0AC60QW62_IXOPE|nr:hypothetical protein HPB47_015159 [Ixodes persulcatus]